MRDSYKLSLIFTFKNKCLKRGGKQKGIILVALVVTIILNLMFNINIYLNNETGFYLFFII